jgi:hypothetical protein
VPPTATSGAPKATIPSKTSLVYQNPVTHLGTLGNKTPHENITDSKVVNPETSSHQLKIPKQSEVQQKVLIHSEPLSNATQNGIAIGTNRGLQIAKFSSTIILNTNTAPSITTAPQTLATITSLIARASSTPKTALNSTEITTANTTYSGSTTASVTEEIATKEVSPSFLGTVTSTTYNDLTTMSLSEEKTSKEVSPKRSSYLGTTFETTSSLSRSFSTSLIYVSTSKPSPESSRSSLTTASSLGTTTLASFPSTTSYGISRKVHYEPYLVLPPEDEDEKHEGLCCQLAEI